jgi:hypothetical protein
MRIQLDNKKLEEIINKLEEDGHELIYATFFGSHLYGLNDSQSDVDIKFLFKPSIKSLVLGNSPKTVTYSSGSCGDKNSAEDIDIQGFSLQYFLELLRCGETNMVDILYSFNTPSMIYCYNSMLNLFNNHKLLFSVKNTNSYIGYAIGQAKKYGIRGSRLGFIKDVYNYICRFWSNANDDARLKDCIDVIISKFGDSSYCFKKQAKNGKYGLVLCGKMHMEDIKISEFYSRVKEHYETYGKRAKEAEQNKGIDWKALSHALRALYQTEELILIGKIKFPLDNKREILYNVKKGKIDYKAVEKLILEGIDRVKSLQETISDSHKYCGNFVENFVLELYGEKS